MIISSKIRTTTTIRRIWTISSQHLVTSDSPHWFIDRTESSFSKCSCIQESITICLFAFRSLFYIREMVYKWSKILGAEVGIILRKKDKCMPNFVQYLGGRQAPVCDWTQVQEFFTLFKVYFCLLNGQTIFRCISFYNARILVSHNLF